MDGLIAYALAKKYTDAVGQQILSAGFKVQVEDDRSILSGEGQEKILYLIPKSTASQGDGYDEYVYANNTWEWVGHTDVDLSGYQTLIDSSNKLDSDLVDDTNQTNKFVTSNEKSTWNGKYDKPSGGIPKADLTSEIQTSLGKADDAAPKTDVGTLSNLSTTDKTSLVAAINELFQSVSNGKTLVASAITDKGVSTSSDATFATMAQNIENIPTGGGSVAMGIDSNGLFFSSDITEDESLILGEDANGIYLEKEVV